MQPVALAVDTRDTDLNLAHFLHEMTHLDALTILSEPTYTAGQFSSYDRLSTDPKISTVDNWFANYDRNQHLRIEEVGERKEYVLMDASGPGVVVRVWSANPDEGGVVRFYLDHATEPVIEMPLTSLLGGATKPFIHPFSGERGKGWNCYFPIAYAEHCKITVSEGDIYYLINYRTYEKGTGVTTFTFAEAEAGMPEIRSTAERLATPEIELSGMMEGGTNRGWNVVLTEGASQTLVLEGPAAIRHILCRVDAGDVEEALRKCIVEIAFDENVPAVVAPLGDFFGTAPGLNAYQSLPSGVLPDGTLYSRWVMPFKDNALVRVTNLGSEEVRLEGSILTAPRPWTEDSLYFHAQWRMEIDIPTRPILDWNYLTLEGSGRFCGVMLHIANPVVQWWGEGDEKIYVDGEAFPGFFGTGTEDYFGYAWCDTGLFTHAYHNQPRCDGPANYGHTCVSRFHIMDNIPFTRSLRFDMELWHWAETTVTQAITAYWYAAPGTSHNFPALDPSLLVIPELPAFAGVEGALEAEEMRLVHVSDGVASTQSDPGNWPWSRATQLWWRDGNPGDQLTLGFKVENAGDYEIMAVFTKAPDYGIHTLSINGVPVGETMDFYHPEVIVTEPQSLGTFTLKEGENTFEVRIVGSNPAAIPAHMFGLDYITLK